MPKSSTENSLLSSILKTRPKVFQNKRISEKLIFNETNNIQLHHTNDKNTTSDHTNHHKSSITTHTKENHHTTTIDQHHSRRDDDSNDTPHQPSSKKLKAMNTKSFYPTSMLRIQHIEERVLRFLADIRHRITSKQKPTPWQHFPTQQPAFDFADNKDPSAEYLRVFSVELSATGKRRFLVTTYTEFWKRYKNMIPCHRHYYEIIRQHWPCHLYLDLEYNIKENPDFDGQKAVDAVIKILSIHYQKHFQLQMDPSSWIIELDSTSNTKFSRHLILRVPGAAFASNTHAGAFITEVCTYAQQHRDDDPCCAMLFVKKGDSEVSIIDPGVYTKNRAFRLHLSSKAGKNVALLPTDRFLCSSRSGVCVLSQEQIFMASLICNVDADARLLRYHQYNNNTNNSLSSMDVNITAGTARQVSYRNTHYSNNTTTQPLLHNTNAKNINYDATTALGYGPSPYPELDSFIESICNEGHIQGRIRSWAFLDTGNIILYNIKDNRYCGNINRHHKSNGIYYVVDLQHGVWFQKCYDPECRQYRSPAMPLPVEIQEKVAWEDIDEEGEERSIHGGDGGGVDGNKKENNGGSSGGNVVMNNNTDDKNDLSLWGLREESEEEWDEAALQIDLVEICSAAKR